MFHLELRLVSGHTVESILAARLRKLFELCSKKQKGPLYAARAPVVVQSEKATRASARQ
jgi:hypothetical protein